MGLRSAAGLLALLLPLPAAAGGAAPPAPIEAVVGIHFPGAAQGNYAGLFANFSATPEGDARSSWLAFVAGGNSTGCEPYGTLPALPAGRGVLAVVARGGCTAEQKAGRALEAGLRGVIICSENASLVEYIAGAAARGRGATVLSVTKALGDKLASWQKENPNGLLDVDISVYRAPSVLDVSEFLLISLATSLAAAGSLCATADLRLGSPLAARPGEVMEMGWSFPFVFLVSGSTTLVVLYFLMRYLIYVIIGMFCLGGAQCIWEMGSLCLRYAFPVLQYAVVQKAPLLGRKLEVADLMAGAVGVAIPACWLALKDTESGWVFQDIIGAGFLCMLQRTWRLTSMKLAALLLVICFFFDIFWVFLSPFIFPTSVMVTVATGGGTGQTVPMLLRMPAIGDPLGRDRMIGFGDVALPGLLISYLRRHDVLSQRRLRRGYWLPSLVGYFAALCVTVCALFLMGMGQPALLYLVPGTLGTTCVLGWRRGELRDLWEGIPSKTPLLGRERGVCNYCPGGHPLRPAVAEAGRCDGCHKRVEQSETVYDCRACNWYLCKDCRTQDASDAAAAEAREPRLVAPEV